MFGKVDLHKELLKEQSKKISTAALLPFLEKIWMERADRLTEIKAQLKRPDDSEENVLCFEKMDMEKVFHLKTIKKICIKYRLRFLDARLFKGAYPENLPSVILDLELAHQVRLKNFKMVAPSKLFQLRSPDDPLLFVPIGNGYYYLVCKWGKELNSFRKLVVRPFRNLESLLLSSVLASLFLTLLGSLFFKSMTHPERFALFLFSLKSAVFLSLYFFFLVKKNFNKHMWNSRYF